MYSARWIFAAALVSFFGLGSALYVRSVGFYNPTGGGGSMLDNAGDGLGKPLNVLFRVFCCYCLLLTSRQVIISSHSSAGVLTDNGILNYARAIGL